MTITSTMRQLHNKNAAKKRLKKGISLVLAVSLMLSTLCILFINVAAEVLPISNDVVDGITMNLFNYGSDINRYMRNTNANAGRVGDFYYNTTGGVTNTYAGGFLPFVDKEGGSGGSVDHVGNEGAMDHSFPSMSYVLDSNGMPVINEQPTSVLYQPNGTKATYFDDKMSGNGLSSSPYYDQGNKYNAITWTPAKNGGNFYSDYAKSGIGIRTPAINSCYNLISDANKITISGWIYVDRTDKGDKGNAAVIYPDDTQICLALIPKGYWSKKIVGSTTEYGSSAEQWAFRHDIDAHVFDKNGNKTNLINKSWNYFEVAISEMPNGTAGNSYTLAAYNSYKNDTAKQIEAALVYENSTVSVAKTNTIKVAGLTINHSDKGSQNLMPDEFFDYANIPPKFFSPVEEETGRIGKTEKTQEVISDSTEYDSYFCDVINRYINNSSAWYTKTENTSFPTVNPTDSNGNVTYINRKRGMVVTTDVQIPYIMNYKSKYTLELDIYFQDTYLYDSGLNQNMIISILTDGYDDKNSKYNEEYGNYVEDYAYRYLLFNEGTYQSAPVIKAGWNHLSIPLDAANWQKSGDNISGYNAPYDALVNTGKITGISFHENLEEYVGTYDFAIGNVTVKKNNGVGIYPTYFDLVTVNYYSSNTVTNTSSVSTKDLAAPDKYSEGITIKNAIYSNNNATATGYQSRQGVYITTRNDYRDYRYIYDSAPQNGTSNMRQDEYFISLWLYIEPKDEKKWDTEPVNNVMVGLVSEGGVDSLTNYDGTYPSIETNGNHTAYSEHYFFRRNIGDLDWGWNHILVAMYKDNFLIGTTSADQYYSAKNFEETGRIDGIFIHEYSDTGHNAQKYNLGVGGVSIFNYNDAGSLAYLFDPSKATVSEEQYNQGMADRLNATGDADAYEPDTWHNDYDDAAYRYQSCYFPVDKTSTGLFQYDKTTGTYYYKSTHNAATYNQQTDRFDLYNYTLGRYESGYEMDTRDLGYPTIATSNFYPFNTGHLQGELNYASDKDPNYNSTKQNYNEYGNLGDNLVFDSFDSNKPEGVIPDSYSLLQNSKETELDLSFGFSFNFNFYQPKGGITSEGNEMVFSFTGDDDIWVYVDGVMFLDIGGAHPARNGTINFKTGVIKFQNQKNTGATKPFYDVTYYEETSIEAQLIKARDELEAMGLTSDERYTKIVNLIADLVTVTYTDEKGNTKTGKTFSDYSEHQLDFFYLERGGSEACCMIEFNLEPLPENSLMVQKDLVDEEGNPIDLNEETVADYIFNFRLLDENGAAVPDKKYRIVYTKHPAVIVGPAVDRTTGADGSFILPAGCTVIIEGVTVNTLYTVQETAPPGYQIRSVTSDINSEKLLDKISGGGQEITVRTKEAPGTVIFKNNLVPPIELSDLKVEKKVTGTDLEFVEGRTYNVELYIDKLDMNTGVRGYYLYDGIVDIYNSDGTLYKGNYSVVSGKIPLKDGQYVIVNNLPIGTKVALTERAMSAPADHSFIAPTYNGTTVKFGDPYEHEIVDGENYIEIINNLAGLYGNLLITKSGIEELDHHDDTTDGDSTKLGKEEQQTSIFVVKGLDVGHNDNIELEVSIVGNGSVLVRNLPSGNYDIIEKTDWAWRYNPGEGNQTKFAVVTSEKIARVEFVNNRENIYYLSGDNIEINTFN